ncbi:MAG: hypothetical protein ABEI52_10805 [Halobacteriaceae archaeon]
MRQPEQLPEYFEYFRAHGKQYSGFEDREVVARLNEFVDRVNEVIRYFLG